MQRRSALERKGRHALHPEPADHKQAAGVLFLGSLVDARGDKKIRKVIAATRVTHYHRISWVARESSKPGRGSVERWTVQASPLWSAKHLEDDAERVKAKMLKGFAQITGIRAEPAHAQAHLWRYAQTQQPLGQPFLWDAEAGIGLCGDWCLGHRVENAFVSGLELALKVA